MNKIAYKKYSIWIIFFIFISYSFFSIGYSNIKIKTSDLRLLDDDAYIYRDIAENGISDYYFDHRSSRILVPGIAHGISKINILGQKFNTPGANIFFVSTVLCFLSLICLFRLGELYFDKKTAILATFLFMISFSTSNYMFMGYPDSAEFLLSTLLFICLSKKKYWYILPIYILAAFNRESFILFSLPLLFVWCFFLIKRKERLKFLIISSISALLFMLILTTIKILLQETTSTFSNQFFSWINFDKFFMYVSSDHIRMFLYPMLFLLPLGLMGSKDNKKLLYSIITICFIYFFIGGLFIGSGAAVGRYLFSSAGPLLLISQSFFLIKIYNYYNEINNPNPMS